MAKREISPRQKQYILDNCNEKSAYELAKHLGVPLGEVNRLIYVYKKSQQVQNQESGPVFQVPEMNKYLKNSLYTIGLLVLFLIGFYFRMYPAIKQDHFMLDYDYAFHLRMTESVVEHGAVPKIDTYAWYPDGKEVRKLLPVILYYLGAGFHIINRLFRETTVQDSIVLFYGLLCSFTMLGIFFLLREVTKKNHIAFIGATLAALMPANVVRTFCTRFRYEGPGVIFLIINMIFFTKALNAKSDKKFYAYSIISSVFMMLSIGTWRVSLLFPTLYCIVFLLLIVLRRTDVRFLGAFSIQCAGVALSALIYTFLSSQNYIFSHNSMLVIGLGITAMGTQWWRKKGMLRTDPLLLLIPLGLVLIVPMFHLSSGYESFLKVLVLKIRFGIQKFRIRGIENILFMNTAELSSVALWKFFKWDLCSWSAIFIFYYPITLIFFRAKKEKAPVGEILIALFFVIIFFLTMLFYRNKVLLSLFVALVGALSVDRTIRFFQRNRYPFSYHVAVYVAVAVLAVGTGWRTNTYIHMLRVEMRVYLEDALVKLEKINKKRMPVVSYWSYGYTIQTYAKSPTYLDGLLESPLVHKRLVEMSKLLLQNDENKFYEFCKKYGMGVYFVDKFSSRTQLYAMYAEDNYYKYFERSGKPTKWGRNCIRAKSIYDPKSFEKFRLVYSSPRFNIFIVL